MTGYRLSSLGPLLLFSGAALSCGGSRNLQSVTLQPATADGKNGPVQFTAIGSFSQGPSPVTLTSKDVSWCTGGLTSATNPAPGCVGNIIPFATVDENGLAQCNAAQHGTGYILAGTQGTSLMPDGGGRFKIFGSATLTCP